MHRRCGEGFDRAQQQRKRDHRDGDEREHEIDVDIGQQLRLCLDCLADQAESLVLCIDM